MSEEIIKSFLDYGIIAVICGILLWYVITSTTKREEASQVEGQKREDKLYQIISDLTQKFDILGDKIDGLKDEIKEKKDE